MINYENYFIPKSDERGEYIPYKNEFTCIDAVSEECSGISCRYCMLNRAYGKNLRMLDEYKKVMYPTFWKKLKNTVFNYFLKDKEI